MLDLTNQTVINEINILIQKYLPLLEIYANKQNDIPNLAYIIDNSIKHIKENHKELNPSWKAWSVVIVIREYFNGRIKTIEDMNKTIDEFIKYYNQNYQVFSDDLISASVEDNEYAFLNSYKHKKIGK